MRPLLLATLAGVAAAQTVTQDPTDLKPLIHDFVYDEYRMWTSPFRFGNYDSHSATKYGLPSLVISGALIGTDRQTADVLPNTLDQQIWSGRVSHIGAPYTVAGIAGGLFLTGTVVHNK